MEEISGLVKIVPALVVLIIVVAIVLPQMMRVLREYERGGRGWKVEVLSIVDV